MAQGESLAKYTAICSQSPAIQDGSRKYGREQEEQASTGRDGDCGLESCTWKCCPTRCCTSKEKKTSSRDFAGSPALKDKQGGRVSTTSGNKGSKSNWEVEEGRTAVDNTQRELIDKDDTCSMEQASAARAGDHGPGGASAAICSQPKDGSRKYGQEEQASTERAGDHGPRKDANPKTYSGGASAAICSQPKDGSRKYGQEEQASTGRAGDHGPRKDANPKTYSGLQNQGSTCYLNTVLQILFMTDECREAVMRLNEADGNPVSEQLKKLFDKLNRNQVPDTRGIIRSLGITDVCRQEDASEYFKKILSKVNPDVTKIYEGTITETVTCKKEHQLKNKSSPFTLISLSINNTFSGIISVEDAWKDHFKSTEATLYCSSCESETLAQFESKINVFPQILALHLDRLDIFSGQKNTCKVKIPFTLTDKGWTYELYAIANHHGSPRGGHYNAFIKPYGDKCWWLFDDLHVRKMEELQRENLLNSPAEDLLFYKKISSDDLKAENTLEKGNDRYPSQDHRKLPTSRKPRSRDFAGSPALKDKQGGRVSTTSGNKGSKSNWEVEEGRTAVDNTQRELIDKDDTCSMEQASAARAGDYGPGGASAIICSQPRAIQDGSRKYGREQEEQASTGRAGDHGPRKDANPKTYSDAVDLTRSALEGPDEDEAADACASLCCCWSRMCPCISSGQQDVKENMEEQLERLCGTLKANKSAQTQEMAKFCSILIQITEITGPINEQLKDYEHLSALFVDENRAELIERVGTPMPIADSLFPKNIIEHQQYQEIQAARTSHERMRLIYTALNSAEAKKAAFLELLVQKDRYLVQDLARKKLGQLEASDALRSNFKTPKTEEYAD